MTIRTLQDVADRLRKAGATVPLPQENTGTVESAMKTGLSIALVIVEEALNAKDPDGVPILPIEDVAKAYIESLNEEHAKFKATVFKAVDDYAHGRLLLFEMCDRIGAPFPEDKKVHTLAQRVKELEAELDRSKVEWSNDLMVAGKMRGDLIAEVAALQERVAYAEKDRDEALAEKDAALTKTKEKMKRAGARTAQLRRLVSDAVDFIFSGPLGERADEAAKLKARAAAVLLDVSTDDLEKLRQSARDGVRDGLEPLKTFAEAVGQVFSKAIEVSDNLQKCHYCRDTGVIETGNNDLPCEHCPKGQTALFNTGSGNLQTGEQVLRGYNPPGNLRQPPSWKKTT